MNLRKTHRSGLYNYWKFTFILLMLVSMLGIIEEGLCATYSIEYVDTIVYVSLDPSTYSSGCYKTKIVENSNGLLVNNKAVTYTLPVGTKTIDRYVPFSLVVGIDDYDPQMLSGGGFYSSNVEALGSKDDAEFVGFKLHSDIRETTARSTRLTLSHEYYATGLLFYDEARNKSLIRYSFSDAIAKVKTFKCTIIFDNMNTTSSQYIPNPTSKTKSDDGIIFYASSIDPGTEYKVQVHFPLMDEITDYCKPPIVFQPRSSALFGAFLGTFGPIFTIMFFATCGTICCLTRRSNKIQNH